MSGAGGGELRSLLGELAELVRLATVALDGASAALTAEVGAAGGVVRAEKALAELRGRIEEDAATTPRALPAVVVGVHVGREVEGLAAIAERLLEVAWVRQGREPLPERLLMPLRGIAGVAVGLVGQAAEVLADATPEGVADLLTGVHETGRRQRLLYEAVLAGAGPDDAADVVLLSGYFQECAERAGAVARHALLFADLSAR